MASEQDEARSRVVGNPAFVTTHWSVVLAASGQDTTAAEGALNHLCQTYWFPMYAFVRRRGFSPADAQDLTQEFFTRLLRHNWVAQADRERGRFRSFLLAAMKHFMANEWHKAHAARRGGGAVMLSLDETSAETRYQLQACGDEAPEKVFDREWALTLLRDVLSRLEQEYQREEKQRWFEVLRPALTLERGAIDYAGISAHLGVTENAARVAIHRLRQRYRQLIRSQVAATVASSGEVEEEIRYLFQVLSC